MIKTTNILLKYFFTDLLTAKYNVLGLISGFATWFMSSTKNTLDLTNMTAWVGIAITASIGIFSVLKARQEWLKKKLEDEDAHKSRKAEEARKQAAFEAQQKEKREMHELKMQQLKDK